MNSTTKAYFVTLMLAFSAVTFGLGGVVDGVDAQVEGCFEGDGAGGDPIFMNATDGDCPDTSGGPSYDPTAGCEEGEYNLTGDADGCEAFPPTVGGPGFDPTAGCEEGEYNLTGDADGCEAFPPTVGGPGFDPTAGCEEGEYNLTGDADGCEAFPPTVGGPGFDPTAGCEEGEYNLTGDADGCEAFPPTVGGPGFDPTAGCEEGEYNLTGDADGCEAFPPTVGGPGFDPTAGCEEGEYNLTGDADGCEAFPPTVGGPGFDPTAGCEEGEYNLTGDADGCEAFPPTVGGPGFDPTAGCEEGEYNLTGDADGCEAFPPTVGGPGFDPTAGCEEGEYNLTGDADGCEAFPPTVGGPGFDPTAGCEEGEYNLTGDADGCEAFPPTVGGPGFDPTAGCEEGEYNLTGDADGCEAFPPTAGGGEPGEARNISLPLPLPVDMAIELLNEVGIDFFPDDGTSDNTGITQINLPPATQIFQILGYQDSDGDGWTDYEELSGCGGGVPINPYNPEADCDNYDGDDLGNSPEDPNEYSPDKLLILLEPDVNTFQAPASGDKIVLGYQCYEGNQITSIDFGRPSTDDDPDQNGAFTSTSVAAADATFTHVSGYEDPSGNCHEKGNVTLPADFELNVTNSDKGNHADGLVTVALKNATQPITTDVQVLTVTNAAEEGTWVLTCTLNQTVDGYCGAPGNTTTVNGVEVTYDAQRFPDRHPHPSTAVEYEAVWNFTHTSYKTGDGHNLTEFHIQNHQDDSTCDDGDVTNVVSFDHPSGCGADEERTDSFFFDEPNGTDADGNKFYLMNTSYTVRANGSAGSAHHNQYFAAKVLDRGGTLTYWGEKATASGDPTFDDHDKFARSFAQFSRINQAPNFDYPDDGAKVGHDNNTDPDVIQDTDAGKLYLRVVAHDDRGYGDVGSPGDDLNVTIKYAITKNRLDVPVDDDEYNVVSNLPKATQVCETTSGPIPFLMDSTSCHFEGDDDVGGDTDDGIDDRVDGKTANSEAYEFIYNVGELDAYRTIHYMFSVEDDEGLVDATIRYTWDIVEGEIIDLDPEAEPIIDLSTVNSQLEAVNSNDGAGAIPVDIVQILTNTDCQAPFVGDEDCGTTELGDLGDLGDVWDSDEDGDYDDPNGQIDIVERYGVHYDLDNEGDGEPNDDFDGTQGATAHFTRSAIGTANEQDHLVIRVGDAASTPDLYEAAIISSPDIGVICVIERPGQVDVELRASEAHQFDPESDTPCGQPVEGTDDMNLKIVRTNTGSTVGTQTIGFILYDDSNNNDERDGAEDRRSRPEAISPEDVLAIEVDYKTGAVYTRGPTDEQNLPPEEPEGLQASENLEDPSTMVDLAWQAAVDDGDAVSHYRVYWAKDRVPTIYDNFSENIPASNLEYTVSDLVPETKYNFTVRAYDSEGAASGMSDPAVFTTSEDELDPQQPTDLTASLNASSPATAIDLDWEASEDNIKVSGYRILVSNTSDSSGYSEIESLWAYTNYTHEGLEQGDTYHYLVAAVDSSGNRGDYAYASVTTDPAPTAPTGLVAERNATDSTGSLDLNWTAATDNGDIMNYTVHQSTVSGSDAASNVPVASVDNATFEYTVTGLSPDTEYFFVVKANDTYGTFGPASNVAMNRTNDLPTAPGLTDAELNESSADSRSSSIILTWTAASDDIGDGLTYNVYHQAGGSGSWTQVASGIDALTYSVNGLAAATAHAFNVSATDSFGIEGSVSDTLGNTTDDENNAPTNVTNIQVVRGANDPTTELNVSWDPASDEEGAIANYTVYWAKEGQANVTTHAGQNATTDDDSTFLLVDGLLPNTTYSFTVHSRDTAGNVNATAVWVSGTTGEAPTQPTLEDVSPNATSPEQAIDVSWTASEDYEGLDHYTVYWAEGSSAGFADNNTTVSAETLRLVVTDLDPETTYTFFVDAVDLEGNHDASATGDATTHADSIDPSQPADLAAELNQSAPDSSVHLTWSAATDNVGVESYTVKRSETAGGPYFDVGVTNASTLEFSNDGLDEATTYYYVVRAADAAGNEGRNSAEASITTLPTDDEAPSKVANLTATKNADSPKDSIDLSWTAATDNVGVDHYNVKRATAAGGPYTVIASDVAGTTYADSGLINGTTYYYVVNASDAVGNHGADSDEASATTDADGEPPEPAGALAHEPSADVEVDGGLEDPLLYHFFVKSTDLDSSNTAFEFDETRLNPTLGTDENGNPGESWDEEDEEESWGTAPVLNLVDCDDTSSWPGAFDDPPFASARSSTGGSAYVTSYCGLDDPGYDLLFYTTRGWVGGEVFTYTFTVDGVESGPHTYTMPVDAVAGLAGGDAPDVPDVPPEGVPPEDVPGDNLCFRGTPVGTVGICYAEYADAYRVYLGPIMGPLLPL